MKFPLQAQRKLIKKEYSTLQKPMLDLTNSLQESLTILRVMTVVTASIIGLLFMAADLAGAISALISGIDPIDPPTATAILVIFIFTCFSNAIECLIKGSIMPIVLSLLISCALIVVGSYLTNIAQNLGWLLGSLMIVLTPLITLSVHAALLNSFLNQCGTNCYSTLGAYPLLSDFIAWINRFSLI